MDSRQRSRRCAKKTYREVEQDDLNDEVIDNEADDDDLEDVQLQMEINENEEEIGEDLVSILSITFFGLRIRKQSRFKSVVCFIFMKRPSFSVLFAIKNETELRIGTNLSSKWSRSPCSRRSLI